MDGKVQEEQEITALFRSIKAPYGKYAVIGNHEFSAGIEYSVTLLEKAGFVVIRNGAALPNGVVNIAGVDDPSARSYGMGIPVGEEELLKGLPSGRFTILLKHRPKINKKSLGLFDLQLSGHTHGGQIFPLRLVLPFLYPQSRGLSKVGTQSYLYVSRGTGTLGLPIRLLSPPEITVIDLVRSG
jgi:hypothetical protein